MQVNFCNLLGHATGLELLLGTLGKNPAVLGLCDRFGVSGGVIPLPFAPGSYFTTSFLSLELPASNALQN